MTYRIQNLMLAMMLALSTLFLGLQNLSQNLTSGGYQLFERAASGISGDNALTTLGNFDPPPENASEYVNAPKGTGTVWDNITSTADNLPNTQIPATFKLKSGDVEFYVNSNATKHMGEYLQMSSNPINDQQLLNSFSGAVDQISSSGSVKFNQVYNVNGWEIIFNQRVGDGLPVIKHALYVP